MLGVHTVGVTCVGLDERWNAFVSTVTSGYLLGHPPQACDIIEFLKFTKKYITGGHPSIIYHLRALDE